MHFQPLNLASLAVALLICWFGLLFCAAPPPAPARMTFKQVAGWVVFIVAAVWFLWIEVH
jgi:hypothetical protein